MPKIVTIRAVVEDDKVEDFITDAAKCLESSSLDFVAESHLLPAFVYASMLNETYMKGDFNKELNHGNSLTTNDPHITWNRHGSFDEAQLIRYRYDNLPYIGGIEHTRFASEE